MNEGGLWILNNEWGMSNFVTYLLLGIFQEQSFILQMNNLWWTILRQAMTYHRRKPVVMAFCLEVKCYVTCIKCTQYLLNNKELYKSRPYQINVLVVGSENK
jgi:hypothetical protein